MKNIGFLANQVITFKGEGKDQVFKCKLGLNTDVPGWVEKTDHFKLASSGMNPLIRPYERVNKVADAELETAQKELEEAKKIAEDEKAKAIQEKERADALQKELEALKQPATPVTDKNEKDSKGKDK